VRCVLLDCIVVQRNVRAFAYERLGGNFDLRWHRTTYLSSKKNDTIRDMTTKRMKLPIQDFPIRGTILTPAVRAAAIRDAVASLAAEGALVRGKYLGCPPAKATKKR
jgi:hypothetical protein